MLRKVQTNSDGEVVLDNGNPKGKKICGDSVSAASIGAFNITNYPFQCLKDFKNAANYVATNPKVTNISRGDFGKVLKYNPAKKPGWLKVGFWRDNKNADGRPLPQTYHTGYVPINRTAIGTTRKYGDTAINMQIERIVDLTKAFRSLGAPFQKNIRRLVQAYARPREKSEQNAVSKRVSFRCSQDEDYIVDTAIEGVMEAGLLDFFNDPNSKVNDLLDSPHRIKIGDSETGTGGIYARVYVFEDPNKKPIVYIGQTISWVKRHVGHNKATRSTADEYKYSIHYTTARKASDVFMIPICYLPEHDKLLKDIIEQSFVLLLETYIEKCFSLTLLEKDMQQSALPEENTLALDDDDTYREQDKDEDADQAQDQGSGQDEGQDQDQVDQEEDEAEALGVEAEDTAAADDYEDNEAAQTVVVNVPDDDDAARLVREEARKRTALAKGIRMRAQAHFMRELAYEVLDGWHGFCKRDDAGTYRFGLNYDSPLSASLPGEPTGWVRIYSRREADVYIRAPTRVRLSTAKTKGKTQRRKLYFLKQSGLGSKGQDTFGLESAREVGPPLDTLGYIIAEVMHDNKPHPYRYCPTADLAMWSVEAKAKSLGIAYLFEDPVSGKMKKMYFRGNDARLMDVRIPRSLSYIFKPWSFVLFLERTPIPTAMSVKHAFVPDFGIADVWNFSFNRSTQEYSATRDNRIVVAVALPTYMTRQDYRNYLNRIGVRKIGGALSQFASDDPEPKTRGGRKACDFCQVGSYFSGLHARCGDRVPVAGLTPCNTCRTFGIECTYTSTPRLNSKTRPTDELTLNERIRKDLVPLSFGSDYLTRPTVDAGSYSIAVIASAESG